MNSIHITYIYIYIFLKKKKKKKSELYRKKDIKKKESY